MAERLRIEVIDDATVQALRRLSPAKRWEIANSMFVQCRQLVRSSVTSSHPEWSASQVEAEVCRRLTLGAA